MGGLSLDEPQPQTTESANPTSASSNPALADLDKLKDLYNTPAPQQNPGMGMGGPQPGAFNTGFPMGGGMGGAPAGMGGFGQPMGGMGMGGQPMGG
jgi:hypothetical protein